MAVVAFAWRFLDTAGTEVGRSEAFEDRAGADRWLEESWPGLLERGVEEVELVAGDGGEALFRMSLRDN
jgi:hypothetical protein